MSSRTIRKLNPSQGGHGSCLWKADSGSVPDGCCVASVTHTAQKWCCPWAQPGHFHPLACLTCLMATEPASCKMHSEHPGMGKSTFRQSGATTALLLLCGLVRRVSAWLSGPLQCCDNWFQVILTWYLKVIQYIWMFIRDLVHVKGVAVGGIFKPFPGELLPWS